MPQLRDTEWRLLCVIVRQTLGWRGDDGSRRQSDWLTHSQLKWRTGRASAALSAALDRLVTLGMVDVSDGRGKALAERDQRRRAYTRLYYRLSGRWSSGSPFSEIENLKAKTTKESGTKVEIAQESSQSENGEGYLPSNETNVAALSPLELTGDASKFMTDFNRLLLERWPGKSSQAPSMADLHRLDGYLKGYGTDELQSRLARFLESDLEYVRCRNYSLQSFLDTFHVVGLARHRGGG